jgi:hypothetical protein
LTTLVIIGNGFDIQNGLPTSFRDFHFNHSASLDESLKYFPDFLDDQEWSYFEENLGNFDEDSFRENSAWEPSMDEMIESSKYVNGYNDEIAEKISELVDGVHDAFRAWIRGIDVTKASKFMTFPKDCKFINFNYTETLQKVYSIPNENILHIHGKSGMNIIFGHGNKPISRSFDEREPWFEEAIQSLASVTNKLYKPVPKILNNNRRVLESFGDISKIIVIGHSINEIDIPYFKHILATYPNVTWENWNYDAGIEESHGNLENLGVASSRLSSLCSSQLGTYYP